MVTGLYECSVICEQIGARVLGNSKTYTNTREGHEMEVTWPEQPRFTNAIAIVLYGMPVLVFLTCVIIMSQCSNLVSSGMYYMLFPPSISKCSI